MSSKNFQFDFVKEIVFVFIDYYKFWEFFVYCLNYIFYPFKVTMGKKFENIGLKKIINSFITAKNIKYDKFEQFLNVFTYNSHSFKRTK